MKFHNENDGDYTHYSDKELRKDALNLVRRDAKIAGVRAKFTGYSIRVTNKGAQLVAHGITTDQRLNYDFHIICAI